MNDIPIKITEKIISQEIEIKESKSGNKYIKFAIKHDKQYIQVLVFEKRQDAYNLAIKLKNDDEVSISGFIKYGSYINKENKEIKTYTLFANFIDTELPW